MEADKIEEAYSDIVDKYKNYRRTSMYPKELYDYLATICNENTLVWDCGTGNGQAAIILKDYFDKVIATDISVEQIENAILDDKIEYYVAPCDSSKIKSKSVDLVTAATCAHWFDLRKFEQECLRVCKEKAVVSTWWILGIPKVNSRIDQIVDKFYNEVLKPYHHELPRRAFEDDCRGIRSHCYELKFNSIGREYFTSYDFFNYFEFIEHLSSYSFFQSYFRAMESPQLNLLKKS
ncbi:class I SAM-dependent methyltransferase [Francisella sp. 19X1-34]|uniref:class I SAM-dependent methyltransferase n=1 Tax=Francisella sp. 19X1-34 TaxID=3087177 RepID=UPI002E321903|nr:class I SAM-dependent methyltransferase [Francisella sp. 19X1-34]MED7788854.1 class I SAM-dependent methyltransferase [Francisella sp. 19X1-34]